MSSPGKTRLRPSIIQKVDDFKFTVIRNNIEEFYLKLKIVPTTQKLLMKIKETIEFPYSKKSPRLLLKANGFHWRIGVNDKIKEVLMKRPNIVHWRYKYIRAIRKYRTEGKHVYLDETWIYSDLTFKKCWQIEIVVGVLSNISSTGNTDNLLLKSYNKNLFTSRESLI